jgi:hypothetical protein
LQKHAHCSPSTGWFYNLGHKDYRWQNYGSGVRKDYALVGTRSKGVGANLATGHLCKQHAGHKQNAVWNQFYVKATIPTQIGK